MFNKRRIVVNATYARIVRPDRKTPFCTATDEIRVVVSHPAIIYRLFNSGGEYVFNRYRAAIVTAQTVARDKLMRRHPTFAPNVERVFSRRSNRLAVDMDMPDRQLVRENLFDAFELN